MSDMPLLVFDFSNIYLCIDLVPSFFFIPNKIVKFACIKDEFDAGNDFCSGIGHTP